MEEWQLARGYRFAGVHCGIRDDSDKLDLALIVSEEPAAAAGVFTQNRVVAAPVTVCRNRLPRADARGIVICSGNANACTGQRGLDDAERMAHLTAELLGLSGEQILVGSTGVIGRHLPMENVESGIGAAFEVLSPEANAFEKVAQAILTTDTGIKVSTRALTLDDGYDAKITGIAKGAAMIGPNMATMLAYVMTDAGVGPSQLQQIASQAAAKTFNCISVEGHTSTNDTLILLANGKMGKLEGDYLKRFAELTTEVCAELAQAIAKDAEGASHFVTIDVSGSRSDDEARQIAKTIAESALVKTAIFGADPNWGRIVSAAGYSGVEFSESDMSLSLGDTLLYDRGTPVDFNAEKLSAFIRDHRDINLKIDFGLGTGSCTFWTSDLTYEYIRLNAEYTT